MAQLEVSPPSSRRRHDLRPLDADPEAAPRWRSADLDRRLASGPSHSRRRPLRRGRGRGQGKAPRSRQGAAPPRTRGGTRCATEAARKASARSRRRQRPGTAGDPRHRRSTGLCGQTGADRWGPKAATAAAAHQWSLDSSSRGACREPASGGSATSSDPKPDGPVFRHRAWNEQGHSATAPILDGDFQSSQVLDHTASELSRR
jgi:hypothetical protein